MRTGKGLGKCPDSGERSQLLGSWYPVCATDIHTYRSRFHRWLSEGSERRGSRVPGVLNILPACHTGPTESCGLTLPRQPQVGLEIRTTCSGLTYKLTISSGLQMRLCRSRWSLVGKRFLAPYPDSGCFLPDPAFSAKTNRVCQAPAGSGRY